MEDDQTKFGDALSRLVDEARTKHGANSKQSLVDLWGDLVDKLPEPYPHDDDGFARSFGVDEADDIKAFFDKCVAIIVYVCFFTKLK